jgi:hypothetical protein
MIVGLHAKKFNALCQYGGHHVDSDAKKIERFRDGLHGTFMRDLIFMSLIAIRTL